MIQNQNKQSGEKKPNQPPEFRNPVLLVDNIIEKTINRGAEKIGIKKRTLAYTSIATGTVFSMFASSPNMENMNDWLSANITFGIGYAILGTVAHSFLTSDDDAIKDKAGIAKIGTKALRLLQTGLGVIGIVGAVAGSTLEPIATTIFDFGVAGAFYLFGNKDKKKEDETI